MRENESECERVEVRVSRVKWGASELRESVINYFMLHFNLKFIIVCIFLLPVKAALHHGGFIYEYFLKVMIAMLLNLVIIPPSVVIPLLTLLIYQNLSSQLKLILI